MIVGRRGPSAYNPRELTEEELIETFSAREPLLERLLECVRRESGRSISQHHLIIGGRGMGKTNLLHRLAYAVAADDELAAEWFPVTFREQQFVDRLSALYASCLDALVENLERAGEVGRARAIEAAVERLPDDEPARAFRARSLLLLQSEELDRRLILLIDNFTDAVSRLSATEAWALRSLLQDEDRILLVAASSRPVDSGHSYSEPFLEFFRPHHLAPLDRAEMSALVKRLAEVYQEDEVIELLEREPGWLPALRVILGGSPRSAIRIYHAIALRGPSTIADVLEHALGSATPFYTARLEQLPDQAQKVFHGLALGFDPSSAGELAKELGLAVNKVSTQLNRLVRDGLVSKVPFLPPTKTGFQVAERVFNVWYLMRYGGRRDRLRLEFLVEFLDWFYGRGPRQPADIDEVTELARTGSWREAEVAAARYFDRSRDRLWLDDCEAVLELFRVAVDTGRAAELLTLMAESGLEPVWRPAWAALEAIDAGTMITLRKYAREVRQPAEEIIAAVAPSRELADPRSKRQALAAYGRARDAESRRLKE